MHVIESGLFLGAMANLGAIGFVLLFLAYPKFALRRTLETSVLGMTFTLVLIGFFFPTYVFDFRMAETHLFYFIAPLIGLLVIFFEYVLNQVIFFIQYKKWTFRTSVHSVYKQSQISPAFIALILWAVIAEELLIRQATYSFLTQHSGWNTAAALIMTAFIYSLNHLYFGLQQLIYKFCSGMVYATLFYVSGLSIGVVIIAHATQNIALLTVAQRLRKGAALDA